MRRVGPLSVVLAGSVLVIAVALSGCGGAVGGGSGGGGGTGDPVAKALNTLGVDTTPTNRRAPGGGDLPSGFAPLGSSSSYGDPPAYSNQTAANATDAVLLVGPTGPSSDLADVLSITGATVTSTTPDPGTVNVLTSFPSAAHPWADNGLSSGVDPIVQTLRAAATGDLDADGLQEIVTVYVAPPATGGGAPTLELEIVQDKNQGFATSTYTLADATGISDVAVTTGDFNGDGTSQIVVAAGYADHGELLFLKGASANYQIDGSATKTLAQTSAGSRLYFRLRTGNLDYDRADELAVVVNEFIGSSSPYTGAATLYVYDDAGHGYAQLDSRNVQGTDSGVHTALAGDVSLADIDGDGIDEVITGGITQFETNCSGHGQIVVALDDAAHGFATLGAIYQGNAAFAGCGNYAYNAWKVYFTFIATADLTGGGGPTIVANQFLYDYAPSSCATGLCPRQDSGGTVMQLPDSAFLANSNNDAGGVLSVNEAAVGVGDVTADGRQNILVYTQWHREVQVWGQSQAPALAHDGWAQLSTIATDVANAQTPIRPILVPTQTEPSGPVLKYSDGSYKLVFTEPIVIAALAAAPCNASIAQNVSACVTTFGQSTSSGGGASVSVSVTAGVTIGVEEDANIPFVGDFKAQEKASIAATATASMSTSYQVTKTVTYSTGSMQDGVIFTTIPYDQYTYTIVSAADPTLVGKLVVVSLPRTPITLIAERGFYNDAVPSGSLKIDSRIFTHTIGDPSSYPSASQEASLLSQYPGGIDNGPKTVGEGTGSTQLSIDVSNQISQTGTLAMDYTYSFETSGQGFVAGFHVGYGVSAGLTVTSGSATTYTGTVGSIDASDFAANYYDFGLFTYVQPIDGQKVEVVNYWTTPH